MDDILAHLTPATTDDLDDVDDPIEWPDPTDDAEVDANAEVAALDSFISRRNDEAKRFNDATDTEYWFAVHFPSREHKEAFLKAAGLTDLGDKYLGGLDFAEALDVAVDWPT